MNATLRSSPVPRAPHPLWEALVDDTLGALSRARAALRSARPPGFVHARLLENGVERDVIIGRGSARGDGVDVIDPRTSPLARALLAIPDAELARLAARRARPVVLFRHVLEFGPGGELVAILTADGHLRRVPGGPWALEPSLGRAGELGRGAEPGRPGAARTVHAA